MEEQSAYDVARTGGRHAGLLRTYQGKSTAEIQRALRSYERQVELHRQKMSYPEQFVQDWAHKSLRVQRGLLQHWQEDLARNRELAEVMRGILQERDVSPCKTMRNLKTIFSIWGGLSKNTRWLL